MCYDCKYLEERRSIRELVYAERQPLNRYDESLIESMLAMLKLRNPEHSIAVSHHQTISDGNFTYETDQPMLPREVLEMGP